MFLRVAMNLVEHIRVGQKCAETGFGAEINYPSAIFGTGKVSRVCVTENPSAEGNELA
jgi:hypothetical protein